MGPLRLLARTVGRLALRLLARTVGRLALRLLARTVEALLARMVEASPPRLLARTVEELWAATMAMSGQLSEQAQALLRDWSFFYSHSLSLFYVPLCLACLEFFSQSVLEFACFFGLSMLPSYCGRVLIALRAYAECKYLVPNTRKSASGNKNKKALPLRHISEQAE